GVLVIAPVGNSGTAEVSYPAANPAVMAIAGVTRQDLRLPTSNTGAYISVAAPADAIASTFKNPGGVDGYATAGTTAQAAAQVAGLAALIMAINPALGPDEIRQVIELSADRPPSGVRDDQVGWGRINAGRAVLYAAPWNFVPHGAGSYSG